MHQENVPQDFSYLYHMKLWMFQFSSFSSFNKEKLLEDILLQTDVLRIVILKTDRTLELMQKKAKIEVWC